MSGARSAWRPAAGLALSAGTAALICLALGVASSVGGAACAPVPPEPAAAEPFNTCPQHACALYQQSNPVQCKCVAYDQPVSATEQTSCSTPMACLVASDPAVFLRVDLPASSAFAPGLTFFVMNPRSPATPCLNPNSDLTCFKLPFASPLLGALLADYPTSQVSGFNLGNGPGSKTTLPVTATVTPLLAFGTPATTLLTPQTAGVSVQPPVVAQLDSDDMLEYPDGLGLSGPFGSLALGFFALVAVGDYQVTLQPTAPFDAYFPPYTVASPLTVGTNNQFAEYGLSIDPPTTRATNVRSATALDGMVAYLRNAAGVRISTRVPLHGQDATTGIPLQLQTSGQPANLAGDFFVIAPADELDPGGRATFTNTALSITTGGLGAEQTYPQLPPPVTVAGQVLSSALLPTAANVYLTSTGIDRVDQSAPDDTSLSYVTSFATDGCGNYAVTLPPGTYSARISPVQGASAQSCSQIAPSAAPPAPAQTVTTLVVATTPTAQNGKSLQLEDAIQVTGTCKVADGRALALATVVFSPSTSLAVTAGTVPAPRTFTATTMNDGSFAVAVDPGVYDLTIQPALGSNLPWLVTRAQTVSAPSFALADQVVPAPLAESYVVYEPRDGTIIPNAVVTAYDFPQSTADGGAANLAAVPVAQGITDQNGTVSLLFSGLFP